MDKERIFRVCGSNYVIFFLIGVFNSVKEDRYINNCLLVMFIKFIFDMYKYNLIWDLSCICILLIVCLMIY